jgi:hypothetical protein
MNSGDNQLKSHSANGAGKMLARPGKKTNGFFPSIFHADGSRM